MNVYTDPTLLDMAGALEALPDLALGGAALVVNVGRYAGVLEERGRTVPLRPLGLVEDHLDFHAAPVRIHQRLRDGRRGKTVGLNEDRFLGSVKFPNDGLCAPAVRREVDVHDLAQTGRRQHQRTSPEGRRPEGTPSPRHIVASCQCLRPAHGPLRSKFCRFHASLGARIGLHGRRFVSRSGGRGWPGTSGASPIH